MEGYKPTKFKLDTSHYDKGQADFAVGFIECLCHTKGRWAGKPFKLLPWQEQIIRDIFGTVKEDGHRQFTTAYIEIPKKNGKSELAAAVALYLLFADGEAAPEVYGAAADRQQAAIVFDVANQMVKLTPALVKRSKSLGANKRIVSHLNNGFYQVLSAEVGCVTPDTVIQMENGELRKAEDIVAGDRILAANGQTLLFDSVASVRVEDPVDVYEIHTNHDRVIRVTEHHPFWTMFPGRRQQDLTHEYDWKEACSLEMNDRIAIALGWPAKVYKDSISPLEAWALGAWAGDGDCTHFRFINPDETVINRMRMFMESIGSSLKSVYSTRQKMEGKDKYQKPIEHLIMGVGKRRKSPGREWIRRHFGQHSKAKTKLIPEVIWKGSPKIWAAFLAGYIDTDGCVTYKDSVRASICSVNDEMTKQCQILLARLGINASTVSQYKVAVSGKKLCGKLWNLLSPYMVHTKKRKWLEYIAAKEIFAHQRAYESDKVTEIKYLGKLKTISFEMTNYQTHVTNGLITHNTKHGLNVSGLVLDEVHAQPNRKLYDVLTKGSGDAREQPLYFLITTAGNDTHSICYELHQKALDIIEGRKSDPTFYPVIYGAPDDADWTDPEVWKKANPSLGETITIDKVVAACESAKQNPAEENSFRQLRLNQWVKQAVRWMPMDKWDKCAFTVNEDELEGRVCYGGLDLSSTTDITAFVLVFPPLDEEDKYYVLPYFWIPEENVDLRVRRDHVPYDVWEKQGTLLTTEGNVVHYGYIEQFIEKLNESFNIREIAYDRWGAVQMVQNLEGMGFTVVPFGQGFKDMNPPTKELMKLTLEQKIAHGGHPVLRWMMDNIFIKTDPAGNIKPDKEKSTEKIDGVVATIMALDRAIRCGLDNGESVYDERGILLI